MNESADKEAAAQAAVSIVNSLAGETLLNADAILDEVRRAFWLITFSGDPPHSVCNQLRTSPKAREFLRLFEGKTIAEADAFVSEVRTFLWSHSFAQLPETTFGRMVAAEPDQGHRGKLN